MKSQFRLPTEYTLIQDIVQQKGYSPFEAIECMSSFFALSSSQITYCGLKDEEGITTQEVSIKVHIPDEALERFNATMYASSAYIELTYIGQSNSQEIGKLLGNAFTVTLRNLSGDDAEAFSEIHKRDYAFLNYYDYQRFGIPGYPQVTHLLGKALLDQDYQRAFKLYRLSGNTKIDSVKDPEKFFTSDVDARKLSFFKNAYSSSIWNNELMYFVQRNVPNTVIDDSTGITYRFCKNLKDVLLLLRQGDNLPYLKYDVQGSHQSERSLITHTRVECLNTSDDERHANCKNATVTFILPSGCYATTFIRQLCTCLMHQGTYPFVCCTRKLPDELTNCNLSCSFHSIQAINGSVIAIVPSWIKGKCFRLPESLLVLGFV